MTKLKNNCATIIAVAGVSIAPNGGTVGIDDDKWKIAKQSNAVKQWLKTPHKPDGPMILEVVDGDDEVVDVDDEVVDGDDEVETEDKPKKKAPAKKPAAKKEEGGDETPAVPSVPTAE